MTDFTSALYLGIDHGSRQLPAWDRLTLGKPAALQAIPGTERVQRGLTALVGCERAAIGPSTLHIFMDLVAMLSRGNTQLFVDEGLYPIGRWAVERAAARGTPVTTFPRHDSGALVRAMVNAGSRTPVVIADGMCPASGRPAPLAAYLECVSARDGLVLIDDTQAIGIMGDRPGPCAPYGSGGGGSLALAGVRDPRVVIVGSLAKAFGAPMAVVAGSEALIADFERGSDTRVHCSPASAAAVAAALHALEINRIAGDALRWALAERVSRFRRGLGALAASASLFPVQQLRLPPETDAMVIHQELRRRGIQTVLTRGDTDGSARIGFVLTARHQPADIDRAVAGVTELVACGTQMFWRGGTGNGKFHGATPASRSWLRRIGVVARISGLSKVWLSTIPPLLRTAVLGTALGPRVVGAAALCAARPAGRAGDARAAAGARRHA